MAAGRKPRRGAARARSRGDRRPPRRGARAPLRLPPRRAGVRPRLGTEPGEQASPAAKRCTEDSHPGRVNRRPPPSGGRGRETAQTRRGRGRRLAPRAGMAFRFAVRTPNPEHRAPPLHPPRRSAGRRKVDRGAPPRAAAPRTSTRGWGRARATRHERGPLARRDDVFGDVARAHLRARGGARIGGKHPLRRPPGAIAPAAERRRRDRGPARPGCGGREHLARRRMHSNRAPASAPYRSRLRGPLHPSPRRRALTSRAPPAASGVLDARWSAVPSPRTAATVPDPRRLSA